MLPRLSRIAERARVVRREANNGSRHSVSRTATWLEKGGGAVSVQYPRETPPGAIVSLWLATVLASWMLVGLVVAGVWWIVT